MASPRQARISALPAELQEKLRRRLAGHGEQSDQIRPADCSRPLPLSFAQQRLWFIEEFEPGQASYNSALSMRLTGSLDVAALTSAPWMGWWRATNPCGPGSRTSTGGVPVIHPMAKDGHAVGRLQRPRSRHTGTRWTSCCLPSTPGRSISTRLRSCGPCSSAFPAEEHVLLLTEHHIVTDGWSMGILAEELSVLYAAALRGEEDSLPPLPVQYADYSAWQRDRLSGGTLKEHLDYWTSQLTGVAPLELPTDRPRPAVRTSAGAAHEFAVPAGITAQLKDLARRCDATLFMVLTAACHVLFHRWSGQDDIVVGTPVAGRDRAELERIIGIFINTVVLRSRVDGQRGFAELPRPRVRETVLDAFAHQDAPFEKVVD